MTEHKLPRLLSDVSLSGSHPFVLYFKLGGPPTRPKANSEGVYICLNRKKIPRLLGLG